MQSRWRPLAWLALIAFALNPVLVLAQTPGAGLGILKPGDSIRLTVPGRSELDQSVILDAAGQALIDPVGGIQLGGLSLADATQLLKQKLRLFYPTLDTIQLESASTSSVRIYIMGAATGNGVRSFDAPPMLWDLVRAIGGPPENANLRGSRIIREVDGEHEVHEVDLSGMMDGSSIPHFQMRDGDTLIIPSLVDGIPSVQSNVGVSVFGAVAVPTIVPIEEGTRLMEVLMLAGAPTEVAKKSEIYWVHHDGVRNHAKTIDLEKYLKDGDEVGNPLVYPGDTVSVEYIQQHWIWPFLAVVASVATVGLAYDRIIND